MKTVRLCVLMGLLLMLSSALMAVSRPSQQEKVYLHFDNSAYFLGETIWFKAYVVQTGRHTLSSNSKTLYVELATPDGIVVEAKKMKLVNGKADGFFQLKDSLTAGYYEVRAYTRFILNQGDDAVFSRVFACYDKPQLTGDYQNRTMEQRPSSLKVPDKRIKREDEGTFNLSFFPEGGSLVEGLNSRVAFKVMDKEGKQVEIKGVVVSERGDTLATLKTSHQGMGVFRITPTLRPVHVKKEKMVALVSTDNKRYKIPLPEALPSGYVLSANNTDSEQISIVVQRSNGLPNETLKINLSTRGMVYGEDTLTFSQDDVVSLFFPTKLLPSGVTQITLSSMDGRPLAQRLLFINHRSEMHIEAKTDKLSYRPYEPINIDLSLNDSKGNPVETEFSISVKDAATCPYDAYADNILTNLLLSSELRGHIEAPGYYFMDDSLKRKNDLDVLMLTQGWTRYAWKRVAGLDTSQFYHPYEESLLIEGNVFSVNREKAKEGVGVNMILMGDSTSQRGTCVTDETGRFNLKLEDFYGTSDLLVETINKGKRKEHIIRLDRVFSPHLTTYEGGETLEPEWPDKRLSVDLAAIETDTTQQEPIWTDSIWVTTQKVRDPKSTALPEVQVNAKRRTNQQREGIRDATVVVDVEKTVDTFIDKGEWVPATAGSMLYELLPYFTSDGYKGKNTVFFVNNRRDIPLDEVNVLDITLITVKEGLGTNPDAPEAEVSIYIYTDFKRKTPIGIRRTKFDGYSWTKTFYSPPYDKLGLPDEDDVRRTLYWNPNVTTDSNGNARVSFFNNRSAKKVSISAETVTSNGMIGVLNQ